MKMKTQLRRYLGVQIKTDKTMLREGFWTQVILDEVDIPDCSNFGC